VDSVVNGNSGFHGRSTWRGGRWSLTRFSDCPVLNEGRTDANSWNVKSNADVTFISSVGGGREYLGGTEKSQVIYKTVAVK
jgi:hypothetical protein